MTYSVSTGSGGSRSQSTSTPVVVQTPQSELELAIAQAAAALGAQQYQWGLSQYQNTSAMTDQAVNNYLTASQEAMNLAGNNLNRYENLFQPLENNLIQDAGTYASPARIARNMGMAESQTAQNMDAGRINAERTLQDYGIDPSSGRYQELESAQRAQAAAAEAGAGNQAELATEATGRQLRGEAIAVGQQYPGQTVNALNSAYQGVAGAENAVLGNANTGVNLLDSANPFYQTAMSLRYPPVGQNTQSSGTSSNQQNSRSSRPGSGGNGGSGSGGYNDGQDGNGRGYQFPSAGPVGWVGGSGNPIPQDPAGGAIPSGGNYAQDMQNAYNYDNYGGQYGADMQQAYNYDNYGGSTDSGQYAQNMQQAYNYDNSPTFTDQQYSDITGGGDTGGGGYYAAGGGVGAIPTTRGGDFGGGHVPRAMSPSGGQRTDDVRAVVNQTGAPARLNADEFVIPNDVAKWKGQEFFQKLIDQSRKARMGASAKPRMKQPQRGM